MTTTDQRAFMEALLDFVRDEVAIGDQPLEAATDLAVTGLVDSLGVFLIVDWIEERLGIEIDPGDVVIEYFESVDAMLGYLRGRGDCVIA